MPRKAVLLAAAPALGAIVLGWAAFAARTDKGIPEPARPAPADRKVSRPDAPNATVARPSVPTVPRAPVAATPEGAAIQERVRLMEARLLELEAKRDELAAANREIERQVSERGAEAAAASQAEWRVRAWEKLLGLSEAQKQALVELGRRWAKEDAGRKAGQEAWAAREDELRARLTVEQAAKLHRYATDTAARMWGQMGQAVGGFAGIPATEHARLQQALGDFRLPETALLPEANGAEWGGMVREAGARLRPMLTADQTARLDKYGWK